MNFEEKYFSGYILLTGQFSLPACLYFNEILGKYMHCNYLLPSQLLHKFSMINFRINLPFLSSRFSTQPKVKTKMLNISRTKRAFDIKSKTFFIILKRLPVVRNCLRIESGSLNRYILAAGKTSDLPFPGRCLFKEENIVKQNQI